jgi:hypothetical protein
VRERESDILYYEGERGCVFTNQQQNRKTSYYTTFQNFAPLGESKQTDSYKRLSAFFSFLFFILIYLLTTFYIFDFS